MTTQVEAAGQMHAPAEGRALTGALRADLAGRQVRLLLNGSPLVESGAGRPATVDGVATTSGFAFRVDAIWKFVGEGDVLTATVDGVPLVWPDGGTAYRVPGGKPSQAAALLARIARGEVFNRRGKLTRPLDQNTKFADQVHGLTLEIGTLLRREMDLQVFVTYGGLLGLIREGRFLSHDDDLDLCYLSRHRDPAAVRAEVEAVAHLLVRSGLRVRTGLYRNLLKISRATGSDVDLFYAWRTPEGRFDISYGSHGAPFAVPPEGIAIRSATIGGRDYPVPVDAEPMLAQLYGATWRVPDHGFSHAGKSRKLDQRYALDVPTAARLYWEDFHTHAKPRAPSTFAQWAAPQLPAGSLVLELGCGGGADAVFLAQAGHAARACDASPAALAAAQARVAGAPSVDVQLQPLELGDAEALGAWLAGAAAEAPGRPRVVYARFLFHAIDAATQSTVLEALRTRLPRPFVLLAEFRTTDDATLKKAVVTHPLRRFVDAAALRATLAATAGVEVTHLESGTGLAPWGDEDPHVARLVARYS